MDWWRWKLPNADAKKPLIQLAKPPCANLESERNLIAQSIELKTGCGIYKVEVNPPPGKADKVPSVKASEIRCKKFDDAIYDKCFPDVIPKLVKDTIARFADQLGSDEQ